jgi:hypothetical protein
MVAHAAIPVYAVSSRILVASAIGQNTMAMAPNPAAQKIGSQGDRPFHNYQRA